MAGQRRVSTPTSTTSPRARSRPGRALHGGAQAAGAARAARAGAAVVRRRRSASRRRSRTEPDKHLADGDVVLAAITSCTHTANPAAMLTAGLLARNAVARGLAVKPWVKTTLRAGLACGRANISPRPVCSASLDALGFQIIGFRLHDLQRQFRAVARRARRTGHRDAISRSRRSCRAIAISQGRIHPLVPRRLSCVAGAGHRLCDRGHGAMRSHARAARDRSRRPPRHARRHLADRGRHRRGRPRWSRPSNTHNVYRDGRIGHASWSRSPCRRAIAMAWDSTQHVPFARRHRRRPIGESDAIDDMRPLAILGDGVTTDALSPNGEILPGSPAARFLAERGVAAEDFGNYAARRGNLRDRAARHVRQSASRERDDPRPPREPDAAHAGGSRTVSIFEAGMTYLARGIPVDHRRGRAATAADRHAIGRPRACATSASARCSPQSFESIHRANLVNVGVLPLLFRGGRRPQDACVGRQRDVSPARPARRPGAGRHHRGRRPAAEWCAGDLRRDARCRDGARGRNPARRWTAERPARAILLSSASAPHSLSRIEMSALS